MENFTLKELKILLDSFKNNGFDLLKKQISMYEDFSVERATAKDIRSDVRDLIAYEQLLNKLIIYIDNETKKQRKLKLSTGITTTKPKDVTPETGIPFVSDDELRERIVNGSLVDPKLETTLFPNGKPSK